MANRGTTTNPGELNGVIAYRVAGSDDAGNAFASTVMSYGQTSSGSPAILSVDDGTTGVAGNPYLFVKGGLLYTLPLLITLTVPTTGPGGLTTLPFSWPTASPRDRRSGASTAWSTRQPRVEPA